jgi:hypothetical protein
MTVIKPILPPLSDMSDIAEKHRKHTAAVEAIRSTNKTALFNALAGGGITAVVVSFDGYGDSGQIEDIQATANDNLVELPAGEIEVGRVYWGSPEIERSTLSIHEAIEQLAYDFLEEIQDGWENDDGAYGDFRFDVAARTITLDFNERVSDSVFSQHVF